MITETVISEIVWLMPFVTRIPVLFRFFSGSLLGAILLLLEQKQNKWTYIFIYPSNKNHVKYFHKAFLEEKKKKATKKNDDYWLCEAVSFSLRMVEWVQKKKKTQQHRNHTFDQFVDVYGTGSNFQKCDFLFINRMHAHTHTHTHYLPQSKVVRDYISSVARKYWQKQDAELNVHQNIKTRHMRVCLWSHKKKEPMNMI